MSRTTTRNALCAASLAILAACATTTGDAGSYEAIRVLTSDTGFDDSYDNIWGPTAV